MRKRNTTPAISARRHQVFDAVLSTFQPGRLVDLGAGHGGYARRAADAGWTVTAVDARDDRFPDDSRITWIKQDVREFDLTGFDLVLCLGLWYHLTVDDQMSLLIKMARNGSPVVIDTHVATDNPTFKLSDPVVQNGYTGRLYNEKGWKTRLTASWNNTESFWPTEDEFYRMLAEHGFPVVFAATPWVTRDRTFFLCAPGPQQESTGE